MRDGERDTEWEEREMKKKYYFLLQFVMVLQHNSKFFQDTKPIQSQILGPFRAFTSGLLNAICRTDLELNLKNNSTPGLPNGQNCKKICNTTTVPLQICNSTVAVLQIQKLLFQSLHCLICTVLAVLQHFCMSHFLFFFQKYILLFYYVDILF